MFQVYFVLERVEEALISIAFWVLYSYETNTDKSMQMWRRMKMINFNEFKDVTIVSFLKHNIQWIESLELKVNLEDYNLGKILLVEIQGYANAKNDMTDCILSALKELEELDQDHKWEYAKGIELLTIHVVRMQTRKDLKEYLDKAVDMIQNFEDSVEKSCLMTNLQFCYYVNTLNSNIRVSKLETQKLDKWFQTSKNEDDEEDNFVPSFEVIDVKHDIELMNQLKNVQDQWRKLFIDNLVSIVCRKLKKRPCKLPAGKLDQPWHFLDEKS